MTRNFAGPSGRRFEAMLRREETPSVPAGQPKRKQPVSLMASRPVDRTSRKSVALKNCPREAYYSGIHCGLTSHAADLKTLRFRRQAMRLLYFSSYLLTVLAWGQQTAPPPQSEPAADKTLTETKALVYVYRYKMDRGASGAFPVYCDQTHLAQLDNGRYLLARLEPGHHLFRSSDKQSGIELDLKPAQKYYIQVEAAMDRRDIHGRVTLAAPEQGAYAVKKLRPIDPKKIKNTEMVVPPEQPKP